MSVRSNRWLPLAGLGALVVLNVVLIALLLRTPSPPSADEQSAPPATPPATPAPGATTAEPQKQEPSDLSEPEADTDLTPATRILVNANATTAWRATTGDCTVPGALERSTDQGQTWQEQPVGLAPVSRLRVLGPETLFAIGGGGGCEPTYLSSSTAGASWLTNDQFLAGSWYLMPADRSLMAAPVGQIEVPCEAVELVALDAANAAVLCTDGTVALTQDGGASWSQVEADMNPSAIGVADDGYALAGTDSSCGGQWAVAALDTTGAATGDPMCSDLAATGSAEVTVSAAGGATWLWADDDVTVTGGAGN